jgi:hypothetical protein
VFWHSFFGAIVKSFFTALFLLALASLLSLGGRGRAARPRSEPARTYLGFDRNVYPGDASLPALRKTFAFASYWLGAPPGEKINTWSGKHELLGSQGFGFLALYPGRDSREIKNADGASAKGAQDARNAAAAAKSEGFGSGTIIFLDIEEGGRLPAAYHTYLRAWYDELIKAGFQAGVYCSGIPVPDGPRATVTTAANIHDNEDRRHFAFWAYNDACPPSPGCAFPENPPPPSGSGIGNAAVWQFAQSPRRKEFTAGCPASYNRDGNCYAPDDTAHAWFLDVNSANSPDPSGRARLNP